MLEYRDSIVQVKREKFFIFIIIFIAFLVRVWGLDVASFYIDEEILLKRARLILVGDEVFNPHFDTSGIAYGMLASYLHALEMKLVYTFGHLFNGWEIRNLDQFYSKLQVSARFFSVLEGTAIVYFIYLITGKFFSRRAGLFSAFILAFSFNHVAQSKYSYVDILISLFLVLSVYYSAKIFLDTKGRFNDYLWAGFWAINAFALKYNVSVFVPLLTAHLLSFWESCPNLKKKGRPISGMILSPKYLLVFVFCLTFFILWNPYLIINWQDFTSQLGAILWWSWNFPYGGRDLDNIPNWIWYLNYLFKVGLAPSFFLLSFMGFLFLFRKNLKVFLFLTSYLVTNFLLLERFTPRADRYVVWGLPFFAIVAGFCADLLLNKLKAIPWPFYIKVLLQGVFFIFLLVPALKVVLFDFAIAHQKDTRMEVREYFFSRPAPIYFSLDIDSKFINMENVVQLRTHDYVLDSFNPNSQSPLNLFRYPGQYVLLSSTMYDDYRHYAEHNLSGQLYGKKPKASERILLNYLKEAQFVTDFIKKARFVKKFSHFGFDNNSIFAIRTLGGGTDVGTSYHPNIWIYKIPQIEKVEKLSEDYYPGDFILALGGQNKIGTPKVPFPQGDYLVEIKLKMKTQKIDANKVYGFVSLGDQTIQGNVSLQNIKGKMLSGNSPSYEISLPFTLTQLTLTNIEIALSEEIKAEIERVSIHQDVGF